MKAILTVLLFLIIQISFAQKIDQNLNKYYLPDVKYSSLIGQFQLNGSASEALKTFASNLRLDYYTYRRNANWQNTFYVSGQTIPNYQISKNDTKTTWNNKIELATQNRWYKFKQPKLFAEIDMSHVFSHKFITKDITTPNDIRNQTFYSFSTSFLMGWGRIEDISETWRAVRIFEAFDKLELLYDIPDEKTILELAKEIAIQKNKRFLDGRIGRIEQIKAIHKLLESTGRLDTKSIDYFANLADIWSFGINQRRFTGMAFSLGIEPHQSIFRKQVGVLAPTTSTERKNAFLGIARFEYHKALNYKWQVDFESRFRAGKIRNVLKDEDIKVVSFIASTKASYYPTDRTTFNLSLKSEYLKTENVYNYDIHFYMYNYISPHLRIQTNLRYIKSYQFLPYDLYGDPFSSNGLGSFRYDLITGNYLINNVPRFSYDIRFIYNFH